MYTLYERKGWGSALIEAQLAWYGLPYRLEEVADLFRSAAAREALARVNPLAQVPALVMPDGSLMTESAAITIHLAETAKAEPLLPAAHDRLRPQALRWLVFLVANVYPTFTFADDPARYVELEAARESFRRAVAAARERYWRMVEAAANAPWFLGPGISALDIYAAVMTRWEPRRPWFAEHCPKLSSIALATEALPQLAPIFKRNFPD